MSRELRRRRILILDPEFQYRFIRNVSLLACVPVVVSLVFLALLHLLYGEVLVEVSQPVPRVISDLLGGYESPKNILDLLWPALIICGAATFAVSFLFGIVVSHRMAGPLYRIRKGLDAVERGDLTGDVRVRRNDDFKGLAESLAMVTRRLRSRMDELKRLGEQLDSQDPEQRRLLGRVKELLGRFKTR